MQTVSYCGGAQPTRAILDSCNTPHGISFGKLFVKKGSTNDESPIIIDSIIADVSGNFSTSLEPGNYCLVEEWKSKHFHIPLKTDNQKVDSACFRNLFIGICV
jgi:hypothetical protein